MIESSNSEKNKKKRIKNVDEANKESTKNDESKSSGKTVDDDSVIVKNTMIESRNSEKKKKKKSKDVDEANKESTKYDESKSSSKTVDDDFVIVKNSDDKKKRDKKKRDKKRDKKKAKRDVEENKFKEANKELANNEEIASPSKSNKKHKKISAIEGDDNGKKKVDEKDMLDNGASNVAEGSERSSKNKKKKNKSNDNENNKDIVNEEHTSSNNKNKRKNIDGNEGDKSLGSNNKKSKKGDGGEGESDNKKKSEKHGNEKVQRKVSNSKKKKPSNELKNSKSKSVSFSANVEVFPIGSEDLDETIYNEKNSFKGKRFSPYEDQLIKDAAQKYIDIHQLGENGMEMILNPQKHPEARGCWKEIASALPWRTHQQVYGRGQIVLYSDERGYSEEDIQRILNHHAEKGPKWKEMADELQRNRKHVKDAFRRFRLKNAKAGKWSQEEYQRLFDLVKKNLRDRFCEERRKKKKKKEKNPMIRDDIPWEAVSDKLETRSMAICCNKWYDNLTSPLVREHKWSDADDYRLVHALFEQDECCEEDVDWDNLVETRPGEICQKRWNEMVRHIGGYRERSFIDKVKLLSQRYSIDTLEFVEALEKSKEDDEESEDEDALEEDDEN